MHEIVIAIAVVFYIIKMIYETLQGGSKVKQSRLDSLLGSAKPPAPGQGNTTAPQQQTAIRKPLAERAPDVYALQPEDSGIPSWQRQETGIDTRTTVISSPPAPTFGAPPRYAGDMPPDFVPAASRSFSVQAPPDFVPAASRNFTTEAPPDFVPAAQAQPRRSSRSSAKTMVAQNDQQNTTTSESAAPSAATAPTRRNLAWLSERDPLIKAIILHEVLGPPVSRKRRGPQQ